MLLECLCSPLRAAPGVLPNPIGHGPGRRNRCLVGVAPGLGCSSLGTAQLVGVAPGLGCSSLGTAQLVGVAPDLGCSSLRIAQLVGVSRSLLRPHLVNITDMFLSHVLLKK